MEEEEVWKCPKHPSKRRRSGICPTCLRDRLGTLCPDCANVRPCTCSASSTSSSSSSSSSFLLRFSSTRESSSASAAAAAAGLGEVGRLSNLIDSEPSFRRSRSVAIPFLRSRFVDRHAGGDGKPPIDNSISRSRASVWSVFKTRKSKKVEEEEEEGEKKEDEIIDDDSKRTMMMRSKSVAIPLISGDGGGGGDVKSSKGKGWYFPSPIKVFRQSKASKVVQERSPLYRG